MDAIIGNGLLLQPPTAAINEIFGENEEVDERDIETELLQWKTKQNEVSKFLKDFNAMYDIKLRRIIPIGRPIQHIYVGMTILCHKCQHTTRAPAILPTLTRDMDGNTILSLPCSNEKCGHDLLACRHRYRQNPRIKKNSPILELPAEYNRYKDYDVVLQVCTKCSTMIPIDDPANLAHPCWECHETSYYQETVEGDSFMLCCKCLRVCTLKRHKDRGRKEDGTCYLFCKRRCEHSNNHWDNCESCIRVVKDLAPRDRNSCSVEQAVEHEKVGGPGLWRNLAGFFVEGYMLAISLILGGVMTDLV